MPNQDEYRPSTATPGVEDWRPIPDHPGYEFSVYLDGDTRPLGWVRSWRGMNGHGVAATPRVLKAKSTPGGYRSFELRADFRLSWPCAHSIALEVYGSPRPPGAQCRHLDGDKFNNHPGNLRWGTAKENAADRDRHGTTARHIGERNGSAKVQAADIEVILRALVAGEYQRSVGARYGLSQRAISLIARGQHWSHVTSVEPCRSLLAELQSRSGR